MEFRKCNICLEMKPISSFYKSRKNQCKECCKIKNLLYRKKSNKNIIFNEEITKKISKPAYKFCNKCNKIRYIPLGIKENSLICKECIIKKEVNNVENFI